jgi:hypothetical protein
MRCAHERRMQVEFGVAAAAAAGTWKGKKEKAASIGNNQERECAAAAAANSIKNYISFDDIFRKPNYAFAARVCVCVGACVGRKKPKSPGANIILTMELSLPLFRWH